MQEVILDAKHG